MVPAGKITEDTFQKLLDILEPGDTIVDGGNSNFRDSQRRYKEARKRKIPFVDVGVSGGIWGLEVGFCLMAGGDKAPVKRLAPDLRGARAGERLGARRRVRRRPLREDGPQRDRVRADAGLRRGLRADAPLRVRPRPRARSPGSGATAPSSARGCSSCCTRRWSSTATTSTTSRRYVEDSGEGRWTINEAINENVPVPAISVGALRPLRLAPRDRLLRQGAGRAPEPVRRPRRPGRRGGEGGAGPAVSSATTATRSSRGSGSGAARTRARSSSSAPPAT